MMIAQKAPGGRFDIAPIAVYSIGVGILGAGLWLGGLQAGFLAHAQSIAKNETAISDFAAVDRRVIAVETDMTAIKQAQQATALSLMEARENQRGIQANQEQLAKQMGRIAEGVDDIKSILMRQVQ